ncbi:O-antigen ligase family protein [Oceanobacillus damuensis]|uniref:O-antigen ligase family protein n=1 Tax=Oceanobacillus damuensis TaxID=937928 RepID=UPI00082CEB18|nr:O-antigen ligase family protein [Oceanobacillus damuensis]
MKLIIYLNNSQNSIAIILAVALLSLSYPYGFPLFGLIVILFGLLKVITGKFKVRINIGFILFFLAVLTYILGMTLSGGRIYSSNISDLTNILSFFIIWALLSDLNRDDYPKLIHNFAKYAVFVSFIVSLISLYKFYQLLGGIQLPQFFMGNYYPTGSSLLRDYNMFSLGLIPGLIMTTYLLSNSKKITHMSYYLISFVTIFSSLILAGSRRGWIVAIIVLLFVLFLLVKFIFHLNKNFVKLFKISLGALYVSIFALLFVNLFNVEFNFQSSPEIQNLKYRFETLQYEEASNSMSPRTVRWDYASRMYNDANPLEVFIGSGFGYLPKFANEFAPSIQEDYPHSPFYSTLLFSGLIGLIILSFMLFWSIIMSFKEIKTLGFHFILVFLISWTFALISGNSIFSINVFLILLLVIVSVPNQKESTKEALF